MPYDSPLEQGCYLIFLRLVINTQKREYTCFLDKFFEGNFFCKVSAVAPDMVLEVLATYDVWRVM
jgi:hypothetical protein